MIYSLSKKSKATASFGKGVVQEIFSLPLNSGTVQLTDASYWRPSNKNIHRSHDSKEDDTWGVMPDTNGLVSVTDEQHFATQQIRERRSNYLSHDSGELLKEYIDRLPEEVQQYFSSDDETENDAEKCGCPFALKGNAPYFDPQLDRAIELLKK